MAASFPFKLVTPTGLVFEGPVELATAENPLGEFGVLAQHINYVTALIPGLLTLKLAEGGYRHYVVPGGLAEVKDGEMTVLAPAAQPAEALGGGEAAQQVAAAQERLSHLSFYEVEYADAEREVQLARARERAAELGRRASPPGS